jgi:hypothetical protein
MEEDLAGVGWKKKSKDSQFSSPKEKKRNHIE